MIRPVFTELALFLVPFLVYGIFLWATRAGVLDPAAWAPAPSSTGTVRPSESTG